MYKLVQNLLRVFIALLIIMLIVTTSALVIYNLFPVKHQNLIEKYSTLFDVDESLVLALIKAESNFNEKAVSRANAKGLMQLTEDTFKHSVKVLGNDISKEDIFNPESNIRSGVWYLSYLLKKYNQNETNAIAAYNAGSTNVDKWLENPDCSADGKELFNIPFGETKRHCEKIKKYQKLYKFLYRQE